MNLVIGIVVVIMFIGIIIFVIYVLCFIKKVDKHNRLMHEFITTETGEKIMMIAPRKHVVSAVKSLNELKLPSTETIKMPGELAEDDYIPVPNPVRNRVELARLNIGPDSVMSNLSGQAFEQKYNRNHSTSNAILDSEGQILMGANNVPITPSDIIDSNGQILMSQGNMGLPPSNTSMPGDMGYQSVNTLVSIDTLNRQMSSGGMNRGATTVFDTPFDAKELVPTESEKRSYQIDERKVTTYSPKYKKPKFFTRSVK